MRAIVKGIVIGTLGLAWLLVPVGYVHALDNAESCAKEGFILCKDGACGRRTCTCQGKTLKPGEDCKRWEGGKLKIDFCDGCSGKMTQVISRQPTRPGLGVVPQGQLTPTTPPTQAKPPAGGTLQK